MNLRSLFIKDEPEKPKPDEVKQQSAPQTINFGNNGDQNFIAPPSSGTDYGKLLDEALVAATKSGPDYIAFSKALAKKQGQPLTEQQKYQYAYDAFESMGVSPSKLVQSAQGYIKDVFEREKGEFMASIEQAKKAEIFDKQQVVRQSEERIAELNKQLQQEAEKVQTLNKEIADSINQLQAEEASFNFHYNQKVAVVEEHITKIKTYLDANVTK